MPEKKTYIGFCWIIKQSGKREKQKKSEERAQQQQLKMPTEQCKSQTKTSNKKKEIQKKRYNNFVVVKYANNVHTEETLHKESEYS